MFHWYITVLLVVSANLRAEQISEAKTNGELAKLSNTLQRFEKQLISSLSVPPAMNNDESPMQKWLQLPTFIRNRLIASNRNREQSMVQRKELFVPVTIVEQCYTENISEPHICVGFRLDHSAIHTPIKSAVLYLDLPYQPKEPSSYLIRPDTTSINTSHSFEIQSGTLLRVSLTPWMKNAENQPSEKIYQFIIFCSGECKNANFSDSQLFVEVALDKPRHSRSKRSVDDSSRICSQDEIMCCKRSFVFRPADIGWHWMVHPEVIELNYCMGECNDQTSNYTYSRLLSLLKRSKNANLSPQQLESMKFCCAPKSYSGLDVVYLTNTNNSFQKVHLSNMLVNTCACV